MGNVLVNEASLQAIADAIRVKNGSTEKYLPSEMPSAIEGIQSGGEDLMQYVAKVGFKDATFPEGYELVVNVPNLGVNSSTNAFTDSVTFGNTKGVKKIKLIGNPKNALLNMSQMFISSSVEVIDFTEFPVISNTTFTSAFNSCAQLESIFGKMDMSNCTSATSAFMNCKSLKDIEFKENSIGAQFNFVHSSLLSDTSIQNIIDALKPLEEAKTISFHADVKAKLTEAQISQITSKNWTLA